MEQTAYRLYLGILVFAPLAFGTIDPWAYFLVESGCFLALGFYLVTVIRGQRTPLPVPGLIPLLLFLAWIALQAVPLPFSLVAVLSPATAALYEPLQASGAGGLSFVSLSIHPHYTLASLFRFAAAIALYYLTIQLLSDPKRMRQTLAVVIGLAAAIALLGIIQHYGGNDRIYWLRGFSHQSVFATFAYHNHFAGFIELLLPLALVLCLYYHSRNATGTSPVAVFKALVRLGTPGTANQHLFFGLAVMIMAASILLCGSRGGVFALFLALSCLLITLRKQLRLSLLVPVLLGLLLLMGTGLGKDGLQTVDERFGRAVEQDGVTFNGRLPFWQNGLHIIADFPLTGTGFGTFRTIYPGYQTTPTTAQPIHAHNDYLETLIEGGVPALACGLAFFFLFFRQTLAARRLRRDHYVLLLHAGSLAGLGTLLLHSLIELQFRMAGAITLLFFFVLGVNAACLALKRHHGSSASVVPVNPRRSINHQLALALLCLFSTAWLILQGGELRALALMPEIARQDRFLGKAGYETKARLLTLESGAWISDLDPAEKAATCNRATRAIHFSPLNPRYHYIRSLCTDVGHPQESALTDCRNALHRNPAQAVYLQQYATLLAEQGNTDQASFFFQRAIDADPTESRFHRASIAHLLGVDAIDSALAQVGIILALRPEQAATIFADLESAGIAPLAVAPVLPRRVLPQLALAAWLERRGDLAGATRAYTLALEELDNEPRIRADFFRQPLRFHQQHHNQELALDVLRKAVAHLPRNLSFRLQLGDLYASQGMFRTAREEYLLAQSLEPDNQTIQRRLELLDVGQGREWSEDISAPR